MSFDRDECQVLEEGDVLQSRPLCQDVYTAWQESQLSPASSSRPGEEIQHSTEHHQPNME